MKSIINKINTKKFLIHAVNISFSSLLVLSTSLALSQEKTYVAPDVNIISVTPVQGSGLNIDRVPGKVQSINREVIGKKKNFSVTETLNREASGISLFNLNSSPMQNDINFRGYVSGPLLGTAQSIAVYQNGMRVNESFGEVVQWDLVPDFAINNMQIFSGGDPIFGQNAIGGAITMEMKNGFNFEGANLTTSGGSYGRTNEIFEYGKQFDNVGIYIGANFNYDNGWRDESESYLNTVYGDVRFRPNDNTELFVNFGQAYTDLRGNGAVPLTLMDMEGRDAVYTYPDNTHNKNYYANLGGNHFVNDQLSIQGNIYYRHMERRNYNGDEFEAGDCGLGYRITNGAANNLLCSEIAVAGGSTEFYLDTGGNTINYNSLGLGLETGENEIEDIGTINRSNTKQNQMGLNFQSTYDSNLFEKNNTLITGMTYEYSHNSFASSTELGIIQNDRGVQGTGVLLSQDDEGENIFITNIEATTHNLALYASNTIDLDDVTSVNLSGRWNWASLKMEDQYGTALEGHHFFNEFNPGVGITRKFGDISVYASYKESSRTPSVAELGCADPAQPCRLPNSFQADPPLDQVKNRNMEMGARGNKSYNLLGMNHNISWNASAYAGRNYNDIIFIGGNRVGTGYFRNVGNTQRMGTEIGLSGKLGNKWSWYGNYSYVRASFETSQKISSPGHSENPFEAEGSGTFASDAAATTDQETGESAESYQIQVGPGDAIPGLSPHVSRIGIGYSPTENFSMFVDTEYNSNQFYRGDENNAQGQKVPGYFLLNASAEFKLPLKANTPFSTVFFLDGRNLLDTNFETGGIIAENEVEGTGGSGTFVTPGQPLSIMGGMHIRW